MKRRSMMGMALGIAAVLMMTGCGGEEQEPQDILAEGMGSGGTAADGGTGAGSKTENGSAAGAGGLSWQDEHAPLCGYFEDAIVRDGVVYGYYMEKDGAVVVSQDVRSGTVLRETALTGVTEISNITADAQGNIYVSGNDIFQKISVDGEITVFDNFVLEDAEERDIDRAKGIYVDSEGRFYLQYEMSLPASLFYDDEIPNVYSKADRIYVKDSQLNTLFYEQIPDSKGSKLLSFSFDEKGQPMILAKEEEGIYICGIDLEKQEMSEKIRLDSLDRQYFSEDMRAAFAESGFVFCLGNDLYRYDYDKQVQEKLLNLSSCGILSDDILYLGVNGNTIEIIDNYDKTAEYVNIAEGESSKAILTLGVMMADRELEKTVASYNRFSRDSKIEMNVYYEDGSGDFDEALERLKLDIITGKAPDIMEVSMINTDMLTDKGILADLYGFMDADPEFGRDDLLEAVRKAYERDGHLYNCGAAFQLHTMWGSEEMIQGRYGISMQELQQMLKDRGKNLGAIYGFGADEPVLTTLCTFAMDEWIDWDRGECDFSGEYVKDLMDFASEWSGYIEDSLMNAIRNGEILLTIGRISSVADYQIQKEIYGGEISFVGYPSDGGTGTALSLCGDEFAINAGGAYQENAWDFVKYYLKNGHVSWGFPTLKENFDAAMQAAMEDEFVETMEGTYKKAKGYYSDAQAGYFEVYAASQADVDAVLQLIGRAETKYKYQPEIQNIINEEAESYLQGQKSFQDVAKIIESRVGIYLEERKNFR